GHRAPAARSGGGCRSGGVMPRPAPGEMTLSTPDQEIWLPDEVATARLAEDVAMRVRPGDVIALSGGLGAGKTSFARALLRALADDAALEVPSPTFTLVQTYALARFPVSHVDLYRLAGAGELEEL